MLLRRHTPMRAKSLKKDEVSEQERHDLEEAEGVNLGDDESAEDTPDGKGEDKLDLADMTVPQLKEEAKRLGLSGYSKLNQDELVKLLEGE